MKYVEGAKVVSVSGRYYAMDRDNRWDRVAQAYNLIVDFDDPRTDPGNPYTVDNGFAVITVLSSGKVLAYASVVDNATNDAFFVRGIKRLTPEE